MNEQNKFDGILMTIIQQKGNIDGFFDSVFGFLRRKTDFFANQKKAEEIIVGSCKRNFDQYSADIKQQQKQEERKKEEVQKKKKLKEEKQKKQRQEAEKKKEQTVKMDQSPSPQVSKNPQKSEGASSSQKKEDDNEPAPKGNGGRTQKYIWTQTLENLEMFIFLNQNTTKKNVKVTIKMDKCQILVDGVTLIDGKWKDKINVEETYWTIEDGELDNYKGRYMHINVEKWKNQNSWWSTAIQGDLQINTQKINPEPSKLSDLDGQTRSTVEKMMFDMKQKQQGLPTSDELQKQDKLKEFMKAHPELDFSQCKFN